MREEVGMQVWGVHVGGTQVVTVRTLVLAGALFAAGPALAHDRLPGESHFGPEFDRGPRQSAYLMGGTGKVHFPVTSKHPLVQKFIEQGVGQLHGFWFVEAERSFHQAMAYDPECGIAYWGMSVANLYNPIRAKQLAMDAAKHKAGLTPREKMYIDALTSEDGYGPLIDAYPNDLEAKAFEVWRLWHKYEGYDPPDMGAFGAAMTLAREILRVDPMHPIHHAVIHLADSTGRQGGALISAERCGESAPSIGHLWHMPTHIYSALNRYPEAAWQLEASIRSEHARMMHDRVIPDQVVFYAHNNEWLARTLLYMGRVRDARAVATHMIDLPRHPLLNVIEPPEQQTTKDEDGLHKSERIVEMHGTSAYYGRERLLQVLRQFEYWDDLIEECKSGYIEPTSLVQEQGWVNANLGVAYYSRGNVVAGNEQLAKLRQLYADEQVLREKTIREAINSPERQRVHLVNEAVARFQRSLGQLDSTIVQLESYKNIETGFFVSRKMLFVYLAVVVAGEVCVFWLLRRRILTAVLTVVAALGLGVWLFMRHQALLNLPYDSTNVEFAYMSRKQLEAGDPDVAEWCAREYAKERANQVRPLANLVEILYRVGKKEEARTEFENLRSLAGVADLESPPFVRLEPIAREFGLPTDWRLPEKIRQATASRRSLPSLGPLRWRPWTAPNWKLNDAQGRSRSLAEFRGKPVLMVFFLGRGCLHCKEQLETFAKKAKDFSAQGITVIAVSTDDEAGVKKSMAAWGKDPFPFLMVADSNGDVFRSYRAFDNFEGQTLHGTFLIDGEGLCRWHDVSFEPFMDVKFVLGEAKRLLSRPVAALEPGARVIADTPAPAAPLSTASKSR